MGTVGLLVLHLLDSSGAKGVTLTGIEAQAVSVGLFEKTRRLNGLEDRVTIHHGDIREAHSLPAGAKFSLITGSPPYFPLGTAVMSPHPQKAACRMEMRGSVYDYCEAASRWLAPGGRFVFVMTAGDARTEDAPVKAGLSVVSRLDVVFRAPRAPLVSVLTAGWSNEVAGRTRAHRTLTIRDSEGAKTPEYLAFQRQMG
jgi:tRNA1Val (adenine37-N6)-methyltransferase